MSDVRTFAVRLLEIGIELTLRNNRLHVWPGRAFKHLCPADKQFIKEHRDELKALAASKELPETTVVWKAPRGVHPSLSAPTSPDVAPPHQEPEPEVYVGRYRITEADVRETLAGLGDEVVDAYAEGRLAKLDAYDMAARWLRQRIELGVVLPTGGSYRW